MISTDCRKCAKSDFCYVDDVKPCIGYEPKKHTNADRIRAMTDEELATILWSFDTMYGKTREEHLEWLKEEVSDA